MPAYFSIDFQYKKSDLRHTTVKDFFENLLVCGLIYKSGFWNSENNELNEILIWNQAKLEEDFHLGYTEHYSHGYKQMLFNFHEFSEVRLIINNFAESKTFSFYLIIPEEDFIEYDDTNKCKHLEHRMKIIEELACHMWEVGDMCCIQSAWECSDVVTSIIDIIKGTEPSIEPFAIVPENTYYTKWKCSCEKINRNGIVLRNDDNWFYI